MNLTVDASVYLSACFENEPYHFSSDKFLGHIFFTQPDCRINQPNLFLSEVVSSLKLRKIETKEITNELQSLKTNRRISYKQVSHTIVDESLTALLDENETCRGMDSIYIATALVNECSLVTLDKKQYKAAKNYVPTFTPSEFLTEFE